MFFNVFHLTLALFLHTVPTDPWGRGSFTPVFSLLGFWSFVISVSQSEPLLMVNVNEANHGTFPGRQQACASDLKFSRISELQTDAVSDDHLLIHFSFSLFFFCCLGKREPEGLWRWRELSEVRLVARPFDRRLFWRCRRCCKWCLTRAMVAAVVPSSEILGFFAVFVKLAAALLTVEQRAAFRLVLVMSWKQTFPQKQLGTGSADPRSGRAQVPFQRSG